MKIPKIETELDLKFIEVSILFYLFRKGVSKIQFTIVTWMKPSSNLNFLCLLSYRKHFELLDTGISYRT
jgi:hypothetical protein